MGSNGLTLLKGEGVIRLWVMSTLEARRATADMGVTRGGREVENLIFAIYLIRLQKLYMLYSGLIPLFHLCIIGWSNQCEIEEEK